MLVISRGACAACSAKQGGNAGMTSLFNGNWRRALATGLLVSVGSFAQAQGPQMPAAPLAGGMAAAGGGSYMDAHGNPIVMPASYTDAGGGECYGSYGGPAGAGDPGAAYVDFGGYGPDQCGPYYFDIAADAVFLKNDDFFEGVPAFGSIGPLGPPILEPQSQSGDYEAGWKIAARLDLGALSVLEATYMGIYDFGFSDTVNSVDVAPGGLDDFLFSVFSNYGDPVAIPGLDNGSVYSLSFEADLQSTELSYRRYWLGYSPRISGTYILGARYIRMTEDLAFNALTDVQTPEPQSSSLLWGADNDLVGFQTGADGWICLRQGLRLGGETKAGIYNNRYKFRKSTDIPDDDIDNVDFSTDGNQIAFAGEASFDLVADILPSFSIRGGYQALYMSSLVTVGNNVDPTNVVSTAVLTQDDAVFHGFHAGLEYIW
jgi:hypothetical protein